MMKKIMIYTSSFVLGYLSISTILALLAAYSFNFAGMNCYGAYSKVNSFIMLLWPIGISAAIAGSGFMLEELISEMHEKYRVGFICGIIFSGLTIIGYVVFFKFGCPL